MLQEGGHCPGAWLEHCFWDRVCSSYSDREMRAHEGWSGRERGDMASSDILPSRWALGQGRCRAGARCGSASIAGKASVSATQGEGMSGAQLQDRYTVQSQERWAQKQRVLALGGRSRLLRPDSG